MTSQLKEGDKNEAKASVVTRAYTQLFRDLFFQYNDAEKAHGAAAFILERSFPTNVLRGYFDLGRERLSLNLNNKLRLNGPIGIAAGFDKNGEMLPGLGNVFDYVTFGTMLPYPWPGNSKRAEGRPETRRLLRLEDEEGALNCLGFPFGGIEETLERVRAYSGVTPLSASVAVRPPAEGETLSQAMAKFETLVRRVSVEIPSRISMIEPNFASPNTKGLAVFLQEGVFEEMASIVLKGIKIKAYALSVLKMVPHQTDEERDRNLKIAEKWMAMGGSGVTMINAVKVNDDRLSMGVGGKSGAPIYPIMMSNLRDYRSRLGRFAIINAVGGISPKKVPEVLIDGMADTVQILTPLVYYGIGYVRDAKAALLAELDRRGFKDLQEVRKLRRNT